MKSYLEFEGDIKNLEKELDKLKDPFNSEGLSEVDTQRISQIQSEIDSKLKSAKKRCTCSCNFRSYLHGVIRDEFG